MRRAVVLLPVAAALLLPTTAGATWSSAASGGASLGARSMVNATSLVAGCTTKGNPATVTLTWTASTDPLVDLYDVVRTSSAGATAVLTATGAATTILTDSPPPTAGVSYTYAIRSRSSTVLWTSASTPAVGSVTYDAKGKCVSVV